jgi:hypothetical protein
MASSTVASARTINPALSAVRVTSLPGFKGAPGAYKQPVMLAPFPCHVRSSSQGAVWFVVTKARPSREAEAKSEGSTMTPRESGLSLPAWKSCTIRSRTAGEAVRVHPATRTNAPRTASKALIVCPANVMVIEGRWPPRASVLLLGVHLGSCLVDSLRGSCPALLQFHVVLSHHQASILLSRSQAPLLQRALTA